MRRLQLYQLEKQVPLDGALSWHNVAALWVLMRPLRGRPQIRRGEAGIIVTHRAQLRRHGELQPGMRLRRETRHFVIHYAEPMGRREGWLSCLCEEQVAELALGAPS